MTDSQKYQAIVTYAPYVWLAQNEKYFPSSVDWVFTQMTRFQNTDDGGRYWIETQQPLSDPNDDSLALFAGNLQSAKVYAFWVDKTGYIDLVYFFFYPYNKGKDTVIGEYGDHVGDWEHMTVRVTISSDESSVVPYMTLLDTHKYTNIYNWNEMQFNNGTHPVVYSAWGSHGTWKDPGNHKYSAINLVDQCSQGTSWDTSQCLEAYDGSANVGLNGNTWPTWMSSDFTEPGKNPTVPGNGAIYRWGNKSMGKSVHGEHPLDDGPTGPISKNIWSNAKEWYGNVQIAIDGIPPLTDSAPAVAVIGTELFAVYKGSGSSGIWYSHFGGHSWKGNKQITAPNVTPYTNMTPAAVSYNGKLYVFYIYNTGIFYTCYNGSSWSDGVQVSVSGYAPSTDSAPSAAVLNDKLYVMYKGNGNSGIWYSWFDGSSWYGNTQINIPGSVPKTTDGPCATTLSNLIYIAYKGAGSTNLWYSWFDGSSWYGNQKIDTKANGIAMSNVSTSLAAFQNSMFMINKGQKSSQLWFSTFDTADNFWTATNVINIDGNTANTAVQPAAAMLNTTLFLIYKDSNTSCIYCSWYNMY